MKTLIFVAASLLVLSGTIASAQEKHAAKSETTVKKSAPAKVETKTKTTVHKKHAKKAE